MNLTIIAIGLVVGLVVGVSGVGGGSLMTPLLILFLRVNPIVAVGTDLLYSVPTKLLGAFVHGRQNTVNWRLVGLLTAGGLPGAVGGLAALEWARHHIDTVIINAWVKHGVGVALIIAAIGLIAGPFLRRSVSAQTQGNADIGKFAPRLVAAGAFIGFCVSLTSIGSGSITLPILFIVLSGLGLRTLVGTDIAFAAALLPLAAAGHWSMGNVDVPLAANLVVGSLPGVFIGSKLCSRLPENVLRPAVAGALLVVSTRLV